MIEICSTHALTFGYQRLFSHNIPPSYNRHEISNNCIVYCKYKPGVMMVNIATTVATMNIALSTSRSAVLNERRLMQYTSSMKLHHCTSKEVKLHVSTRSDVLACLSIHCADQEQPSKMDFLTKSDNDTLQTCIHTAFENLQA